LKEKIYPCKASTFMHLQKKFKKITIKTNIVGTCPNFRLSSIGTRVL
jgi:hypothetical protein